MVGTLARFNSAGTLVNDMESSFDQARAEVPVAPECGPTDDPQKLEKVSSMCR